MQHTAFLIRGRFNKATIFLYHYSDVIVKQVFDELGLQFSDELGSIPAEQGSLAGPSKAKAGPTAVADGGMVDSADADLEARLNNLRRD